MVWKAFLLLAPSLSFANLFPRQTSFSNTTIPTITSSAIPEIPTPPPCCWIVVGQTAVGYNKWYSSTAEKVVATVITTYVRENNGSAVPMNSTTLYASNNGTEYPTDGLYIPIQGFTEFPYATVPGVPTDLINNVYGGMDYAGTSVRYSTVATFPNTDLVVTQPTPYDVWQRIYIYTEAPSVSSTASGLSVWPASMCGTYEEYYDYSSTTLVSTRSGIPITNISSTPTATRLQLHPTGKRLYGGAFIPGMKDLNATWVQTKTIQFTQDSVVIPMPTEVLDWLDSREEIKAEYPYIKNCWLAGNGVGQPTVHVPVNALTVTSSHTIDVHVAPTTRTQTTDTISDDEEWTAHTAHEAATASSLDVPTFANTEEPTTSTDIPVEETARVESSRTILVIPQTTNPNSDDEEWTAHTAHEEATASSLELPDNTGTDIWPTVGDWRPYTEISKMELEWPSDITSGASRTAVRQSTLDVPGPGSTERPRVEDQDTELETPVIIRPGPVEGGKASDTDEGRPASGGSDQQPSRGDDGDQDESAQKTARPAAGGVGGLISAIHSVAQSSALNNSPQGRPVSRTAATVAPINRPENSVTGFVIGSRTASPGGQPITRGGSTFSALPSGSGLQVVGDGRTSTIRDAVTPGIVVGPGSESGDEYAVGHDTLKAGGPVIVSGGSTFSALPSGSGVQIVANDQTRIIPIAATPGITVAQKPDSEDEYIVEGNTLTAGGSAITTDRTTFSALPSGSGVQAIANGQTNTIPVTAPSDSTALRSGDSQNKYIISDTTLTAGGEAFTSAGTTYSALPSGSGILVEAEGTTSTASIGAAIGEIDSDSSSPTAILLPDASHQLVTIGDETYTAHATSGTLLVVGNETITPGVTTVINGETVLLNGPNLVLATGISTSTHGLGDAIVSGIGGGDQESTPTSNPESVAEQTTSGAGRKALLCWISGMFSFVFATALM